MEEKLVEFLGRYSNSAATFRNPLHCIIPDHIHGQIVENGNQENRKTAIDTLRRDFTFRSNRIARLEVLGGQPRRFRKRPRLGVAVGEKRRFIYNANNGLRLPGTLARSEGDPSTGDDAVDEAYDGLGATYDLFDNEYERNSLDDNGMALNATVHFFVNYDNAFWNGERMIFGDGDGEIFDRFTKSVDVIGHELTHGVTEFTATLVYFGQPGALNESVSDVFGSLVKQYARNETADAADWLIGAELFIPGAVNGDAIRSLKAPGTAYNDPVLGKDPQPAHMDDYIRTFSDNFGVHINSGIPNHAFYLTAVQIGGFAWERAGLIWYMTLTDNALARVARFQDFAELTLLNARRAFGSGSPEYHAVRDGWNGVGIEI